MIIANLQQITSTRWKPIFHSVALSCLLTACHPADANPDPSAKHPASATAVETSVNASQASLPPRIEKSFRKGMPYADLRKQLLTAGWLPLRDPSCWDNVGGEATVCNELPEVESCSGDGYCIMYFANAANAERIRIGTYGPYDRWNDPQEKNALAVNFWEISSLPQTKPAQCPSQDFQTFLKAFASDDAVKQAFTTKVVKVAELKSDDTGDHTRLVYILGNRYQGFNIRYLNQAYHHVDHEGRTDQDPLPLDIKPAGKNAQLVRYQYGMSEGNSYRFEAQQNCWYLTEDPEAPAP